MGKYVDLFDARLKEAQHKSYFREAYQSMLTSPEWMSVEISENLAKDLTQNTSLFHFPYFRHRQPYGVSCFMLYTQPAKKVVFLKHYFLIIL